MNTVLLLMFQQSKSGVTGEAAADQQVRLPQIPSPPPQLRTKNSAELCLWSAKGTMGGSQTMQSKAKSRIKEKE